MPECAVCGQPRAEWAAHRCSYCGGTYCVEHRLPEQHVCRPSRRFRAKQRLQAALPSGRQVAALVGAIGIVAVVAVALSVGVSVPAPDGDGDAPAALNQSSAEAAVLADLNAARQDAGVTRLPQDRTLRVAARGHAKDMHARDFYDHTNPDGEGPTDRAGCRAAETIHRGEIGTMRGYNSDQTYGTSRPAAFGGFVVNGWANSEGHREIMLDSGYRAVGIGVVIQDGEFFAVAMFC